MSEIESLFSALCRFSLQHKNLWAYETVRFMVFISLDLKPGTVVPGFASIITWKGRYHLWISLFEDVQKLPGHITGQLTLSGPLSRGVGPNAFQRSLPALTILCFCEINSSTLNHSYEQILNLQLKILRNVFRFRLWWPPALCNSQVKY